MYRQFDIFRCANVRARAWPNLRPADESERSRQMSRFCVLPVFDRSLIISTVIVIDDREETRNGCESALRERSANWDFFRVIVIAIVDACRGIYSDFLSRLALLAIPRRSSPRSERSKRPSRARFSLSLGTSASFETWKNGRTVRRAILSESSRRSSFSSARRDERRDARRVRHAGDSRRCRFPRVSRGSKGHRHFPDRNGMKSPTSIVGSAKISFRRSNGDASKK